MKNGVGFGLLLLLTSIGLAQTTLAAPLVRSVFSPDPRAAHYRGFIAYERMIQDRIGGIHTRVDLGQYLGVSESLTDRPILNLLGYYDTEVSIKNGAPNSLSFLLWNLLISGFVENQLNFCPGAAARPANPVVTPEWIALIESACVTGPLSETLLSQIWTSLAGFDAPMSEYTAWLAEVAAFPQFGTATDGTDRLRFALSLVLLNPYVILE